PARRTSRSGSPPSVRTSSGPVTSDGRSASVCSSSRPCSVRTTPSAPGGSHAPVPTATASPAESGWGTAPASTWPRIHHGPGPAEQQPVPQPQHGPGADPRAALEHRAEHREVQRDALHAEGRGLLHDTDDDELDRAVLAVPGPAHEIQGEAVVAPRDERQDG